MDRDFNGNRDLNNMPPYMDYMSPNGQIDFNEMYKDPFLNPMMQYEQACSYYRYLVCKWIIKLSVKSMKGCVILQIIQFKILKIQIILEIGNWNNFRTCNMFNFII